MSTEKTVTSAAPAVAGPAVALIAGTVTVVAAGAVVCVALGAAAAKASRVVCRGVARMTADAAAAIEEYSQELIAQELESARRSRERLKAPLPPREEFDIRKVVAPDEHQELEKIATIQASLAAILPVRQSYEQEKGLEVFVSNAISEQLAEYRRQEEQLKKDIEKKTAAFEKTAQSEGASEVEELRREIAHLAEGLVKYYPEEVARCRRICSAVKPDISTIKYWKNILTARKGLLLDDEVRSGIEKLSEMKLNFDKDTVLLEEGDKAGFVKAWNECRRKAEEKILTEGDIERLEEIHKAAAEKNGWEGARKRVEANISVAAESLEKLGYGEILTSKSKAGDLIVVTGTRAKKGENKQQARIEVLTAEAPDAAGQPPLRIIIPEEGYADEDKAVAAGKAVAWMLESLGLMIEYECRDTHFRGKISQAGIERLRKAYREEHAGDNVELKVVEDRYIQVGDGLIEWRQGMSIRDALSAVNQSREGEGGTGQQETEPMGVKEGE